MAIEDQNIFNAVEASSQVSNTATAATNALSRSAMLSAMAEIGKLKICPLYQ